MGTLRLEPGSSGWESQTLPLCYANPPILGVIFKFVSVKAVMRRVVSQKPALWFLAEYLTNVSGSHPTRCVTAYFNSDRNPPGRPEVFYSSASCQLQQQQQQQLQRLGAEVQQQQRRGHEPVPYGAVHCCSFGQVGSLPW